MVNNDIQIAFLEEKGAILLGAIQILDDYLHFKKGQGKVPTSDINDLQKMIQKFLHILALIDACQVFRDENQTLTDENIDTFISIAANSYSIRFKKFVNDLEKCL